MRLRSIGLIVLTLWVSGCSSTVFERFSPEGEPDTAGLVLIDVPMVRQLEGPWCGPACLEMVGRYWGMALDQKTLGEACDVEGGQGSTIVDLRRAARSAGMYAFNFRGEIERVTDEIDSGRPAIVAVELAPRGPGRGLAGAMPSFRHFMVVRGYHPGRRYLVFNDPMQGAVKAPYEAFRVQWSECERAMLVLAPKPTPHASREAQRADGSTD